MIFPAWPAPFASSALCTTRADSEDAIPAALGDADLRLPVIQQVHGTTVVNADEVDGSCEADAIISRTPALACRIVTADCLPILLADRDGREVAAVHAGWRGLAAGIIEATLDAMTTSPSGLMAWIGPAISQANYEVGREVYDALAVDDAADSCFAPRGDKYLADLPALGRLRLLGRGVAQVAGGDLCTFADSRRFHSYRRDGNAAGRQVSAIRLA